ncbi:hypothetical protein ACHAXA_000900 [Cyclostephanos tholiformis]|uniref:Uncharacterized protein n=1 Tax=Cyclostephanos tholiformis TaxID=382380 RepID=A0ABD3RFR7_9STRA
MEGDMMEFFVMPTPMQGIHEKNIDFGDDKDGPDDYYAGNVDRGLNPLTEEEEEGSLLDEHDLLYINDGKVEMHKKENEKYHYHCNSIEYKLFNATGMQLQQQQQQRHVETNEMTPPTRGVGVKPPLSSDNHYIIPSLSKEYDDPSTFGNNSLISEDSSQIAVVRPLDASISQLSVLSPLQVQRTTAAPPIESLGKLLISSNKKDLAKFFDQVSENILSGCNDYDGDNSEMFYIDDSHFWRVEDEGLSEKSESKNRDDALLGLPHTALSNSTVPYRCKIDNGKETMADRNESRHPSHLQSQQKKSNSVSLATVTMSDTSSKTIPDLPPASSFVSTKRRDTTPLRANTSRASVPNSGMPSIKDEMLEEFEGDSNVKSHYKDCYSEEGYEKSHLRDKNDDTLSASDDIERKCAQSRDDACFPDRSTAFSRSIRAKDHTSERGAQGSVNNTNDVTDGLDFDFDKNEHQSIKKMTSREKRKGHSLAWHSNNGVNDDEHYDSKQWPPSSSDRASRLANRLTLLSISAHTETLQHHFFDDDMQLRDGASSLYHPSYTSDCDKESLKLIQEASLRDNACNISSNDEDNCSRVENEYNVCYSHDDFVKEFKGILPKERVGVEGQVIGVKAQEMNVSLSGKKIIEPSSSENVNPYVGSHDDSDASRQFVRQNHQQYKGRAHSSSRDIKTTNEFSVLAPFTTIGDRRNGHYNKENIGGSSRANHNSKISIHHPHHVPNEVSKSMLEKKLRGLSDITSNVARRDQGGSVCTSELGSLFTNDDDSRHISLPVPRMIVHKMNSDSSARSSPSFVQNVSQLSVHSKFTQGNTLLTSNQPPLFNDNYYGTISSQFSDFLSTFFPNEQTKQQNVQSLPNSTIVTIEETENKSAESPQCQKKTHSVPRLTRDTDNRYLHKMNPRIVTNSIAKTEMDVFGLYNSFPISSQQQDVTSEKRSHSADAVSSFRDYTFRPLSSTTAIQGVNIKCFDRSPKPQQADRLDPARLDFGGVVKQYPGAFELGTQISKVDAENSISPNVEAPPLTSDKGPSTSQEEDQTFLFKSEKIFSATAPDMELIVNETGSNKQPNSNSVSRLSTIAESNNLFPFPNQPETRSSVVATSEPWGNPQTKMQQPQIPGSFIKNHVIPNVKDDASHHSSIIEAIEVAPLKTFAHIGKINTIDDDTIVSMNDLGVHHAYVKPESHLDPLSQASLYDISSVSTDIGIQQIVASLSSDIGMPHGSTIATRSIHGACYQHVVPSQENSRPLQGESASPRQPHFSANMAKSANIGSCLQPQMNNVDHKDNRQNIIKQRVKIAWRKLVMGGPPGASTTRSGLSNGAPSSRT